MGIPKETHLNCKFMHGPHFSYAARVKFQTTVYLMCNIFFAFLHLYEHLLVCVCIYLYEMWSTYPLSEMDYV